MRFVRLAVLVLIAGGCSGGGGTGGGGGGCPEPALPATNGHSILLDGGYVAIGAADEELISALPDGTVEAWVRREGAGERVIAGRRHATADAPAFALWSDASDPSFGIGTAGGGWDSSTAVAGNIPSGAWTHVAVAWSDTALSFFVDGSAVVNTTVVTGPVPDSNGSLTIGGGLDYVGDNWVGAIDEVRLWSWAKEGGEVEASMETMLTGTEPGLVAAWNFEDGGGSRAADLVPACHFGTFVDGDVSYIDDVPF